MGLALGSGAMSPAGAATAELMLLLSARCIGRDWLQAGLDVRVLCRPDVFGVSA